jgi:hypothetical protein
LVSALVTTCKTLLLSDEIDRFLEDAWEYANRPNGDRTLFVGEAKDVLGWYYEVCTDHAGRLFDKGGVFDKKDLADFTFVVAPIMRINMAIEDPANENIYKARAAKYKKWQDALYPAKTKKSWSQRVWQRFFRTHWARMARRPVPQKPKLAEFHIMKFGATPAGLAVFVHATNEKAALVEVIERHPFRRCGTLTHGLAGVSCSMFRRCSCVIALAVMLVGLPTARAADTTLACKGTVTIRVMGGRFAEYEPDEISMGLIVKFTARTIQGTARRGPYLFDDQLPITDWNEGTVVFEGFSKFLGMKIWGSMDRVTGDVGMVATAEGQAYDYALKCSPAQRMF